jgi:putative FmdB family regulatory protein
MPIYEYECLECGIRFDRLQRFGDPEPRYCPNGHEQVHRRFSQPAIIFKGTGFYVTDNGGNASRTSSAGTKRAKTEAGTTRSGSESKESKT